MKRKIIVFSMLLISIVCGKMYAHEIQTGDTLYKKIVNEIVIPYYMALRDGDVGTLKQYLSADMYGKKKVLIEQNKGYPEFLRKYYQGAQFQVVKVEDLDNNIVVNIEIEYPDGRLDLGKLSLGKDNQEEYESGSWKIFEFSM